jgi:hypothetical protein
MSRVSSQCILSANSPISGHDSRATHQPRVEASTVLLSANSVDAVQRPWGLIFLCRRPRAVHLEHDDIRGGKLLHEGISFQEEYWRDYTI